MRVWSPNGGVEKWSRLCILNTLSTVLVILGCESRSEGTQRSLENWSNQEDPHGSSSLEHRLLGSLCGFSFHLHTYIKLCLPLVTVEFVFSDSLTNYFRENGLSCFFPQLSQSGCHCCNICLVPVYFRDISWVSWLIIGIFNMWEF